MKRYKSRFLKNGYYNLFLSLFWKSDLLASVPGFAAIFLINMIVDAHAARLGFSEFVSEPGRYEPVAAFGASAKCMY